MNRLTVYLDVIAALLCVVALIVSLLNALLGGSASAIVVAVCFSLIAPIQIRISYERLHD